MNNLKNYRKHIFEFHTKYILESYLQDWINKILPLKPRELIKYTAIIVEDRPDKSIKFAIYNTLLMTRLEMKIILYTTSYSVGKMKEIFSNLTDWVTIIELNYDKSNIKKINTEIYNKILKSTVFWESLPSRNILVFQTDALLIEPLEFSMFKYDYIGAPFAERKFLSTSFPEYRDKNQNGKVNRWVTQMFNKAVPIPEGVFIGNGGLSIRNRDVMIEICKNEDSVENENEDIYFSRFISKYSKNIVPFEIAKRFSCECSYFESIGCHASYFYLNKDEQAEIYERHIKHVLALIDLPIDVLISL
ncbi:DUF5672 family protein [Prochlorococcus marinus]|nr:DUF5672 family protein [Prochlorococcus marinus]